MTKEYQQCSSLHIVLVRSFTKVSITEQIRNNTHIRLTALFPGLHRWAGTRKVEPIWILLKQETVSGSGISWARCKSAPCSRQITTPTLHHSVFTGRMPFLPPNQQRQSTEGKLWGPCTGNKLVTAHRWGTVANILPHLCKIAMSVYIGCPFLHGANLWFGLTNYSCRPTEYRCQVY